MSAYTATPETFSSPTNIYIYIFAIQPGTSYAFTFKQTRYHHSLLINISSEYDRNTHTCIGKICVCIYFSFDNKQRERRSCSGHIIISIVVYKWTWIHENSISSRKLKNNIHFHFKFSQYLIKCNLNIFNKFCIHNIYIYVYVYKLNYIINLRI